MALLTAGLSALIRQKLDDTVSPYLVSDTELFSAVDYAQKEFAEKTLCLKDSSNFPISVVADTASYALDDRVIKPRDAYLETSKRRVDAVTLFELQEKHTNNRDYGLITSFNYRTAVGTPDYMITDLDTGYVTLTPIPVATETMQMTCYVYPTDVDSDSDALTIPDRWRKGLIAGALADLYSTQDSDVYDPKAAGMWEAKWEKHIREGRQMVERNTRGPGIAKASTQGLW